jgi:large repetitive protein
MCAALVGAGAASWLEPTAEAAVSSKPDYAVTVVSGPSFAAPGEYFTLTTTICNAGGVVAPWNEAVIMQSFDLTIDMTDLALDTIFVPALAPGQCDTQLTRVAAWQSGASYLGLIVDPFNQVVEDSETNNSLASAPSAIGFAPDLVVTAISGPPSANGSFTVTATLCNRGTLAGYAGELRFYASVDPTITGSFEDPERADVYLGSGWPDRLEPNHCASTPTTLSSPPGQGAFYLGATIDEQGWVDELFESDNHFTGALIGFGDAPDLVVTAVSGPPSASAPFAIAATVCNQGTRASSGGAVRFYASADRTITGALESPPSPDLFLGSRAVPALQPGQCETSSASATPPSGTGAFYLGAIVDEAGELGELIESNNHTTGAQIGLGDAPDLVVTAVSGPPSANGRFAISSTVCNQGTSPAIGVDVQFYASTDATITGSSENSGSADALLGARTVGLLAPGQCDTGALDVSPPPATGAFYLGAIVDERNLVGELIESNNHTTGALIGFGNGPDVVVTAISGRPGAFSVTVCNQGTRPADGVDVELYASDDATIVDWFEDPRAPDVGLGSVFVDHLPPGRCELAVVTGDPSSPLEGAFYVGAIVSPMYGELVDANNHFTGPLTGFGWLPDLVVTAVSGPPSASGAFTLTSTVCNQGSYTNWGAVEVRHYASLDPTITGTAERPFASDRFLGSRFVGFLLPGQCDTGAIDVASPEPGVFYLGAIVDESDVVRELFETNNHTTGALIGIGDGPDLVVTAVTGPPVASAPFAIAATVCNQGTQPSSSVDLRFYASVDPTITGAAEDPARADFLLGSRSVGPLAPGQCVSGSSSATPPPGPGAYYLGAIVDEAREVAELIEANNHTTGALIGLGYAPDLVVTAVTGPPAASGRFAVSSKVCNRGTLASGVADVRLYATADLTLTGTLESPVTPDFFLGEHVVSPLAPGQCDERSLEVDAPQVTGAFYLGAIVDERNLVGELIESNNHATGSLIGLGNGPDLIVRSLAAPPSAYFVFTIDSPVCNQGTQPSSIAEVRYYAVAIDADPQHPDILLGTRTVLPLPPGQCDDIPGYAFAFDTGVFQLRAVVDEANIIPELIETNNRFTGPLIGSGWGPDLVVTAVSGPATASAPFAITSTVCNQGTAQSDGAELRFYASADATITGSVERPASPDFLLGARVVGPLQPGQCDRGTTDTTSPPTSGTFYLGAIVDEPGAIYELNESNNHTTGAQIVFGDGPDLVVTAVSGPATASAPFAIASTVCNQGT